jgi:uncharacterized DUF497 family protein
MSFDWDPDKAARNLEKHGVSFEEAATVFSDPLYLDFFDPEHSEEENRYIRVGCSSQKRVLVIAYTERGDQTRIISARPATKHERQAYEQD